MPSNTGILASGASVTEDAGEGTATGAPGIVKFYQGSKAFGTALSVTPYLSEPTDLFVLIVGMNPGATGTILTPAGWTRHGIDYFGGTGPQGPAQSMNRVAVFSKAGDGTVVSVLPTFTGDGCWTAVLYQLRGGGDTWTVSVVGGVRDTDTANNVPWTATADAALTFTTEDLLLFAWATDQTVPVLQYVRPSTAAGHSWVNLPNGNIGSASSDYTVTMGDASGDDMKLQGVAYQCYVQPTPNNPWIPSASVLHVGGATSATSGPYVFVKVRCKGTAKLRPFIRGWGMSSVGAGTWSRRVSGSMKSGDKQLVLFGGKFNTVAPPDPPTGWSSIVDQINTAGTNTVDQGTSRIRVWEREVPSPMTAVIQEGSTMTADCNCQMGMTIGAPANKTLTRVYTAQTADNDISTATVSFDFGPMTLEENDLLVLFMSSPTDTYDPGTPTIAAGTAFLTTPADQCRFTEWAGQCIEPKTTSGSDMRLLCYTAYVTTGGTGNITFSNTTPTAASSTRPACLLVYRAA